MSGIFFNGRKYVTPVTVSAVDDTAMFSRGIGTGSAVGLIGRSAGGQPNTALRFRDPQQAVATLVEGELLTAVLKAFNPSSQTGAPSEVVAVRVNPATQAALTLQNASAGNVISLLSTDYGARNNQIKIKIESGTNAGKKITTALGDSVYTEDDVTRTMFSITYGGAGTASISVSNSAVTLKVNASAVATITLADYPTVQQLVDRINVVSSFVAVVVDGNGSKATVNAMDTITDVTVNGTALSVLADLQAVIDWINGNAEGFLTASRVTGAGLVPANIAYTYLSGGSDGTVTNSEWQAAYTTLQGVDVRWVVPVSDSAAIHAMNQAHCLFMSSVGRSERRGIVGTAAGTTDATAIAAAKSLNSDRTSLVHVGFYDYNAAGELALYPPYILAAMIAGAFAGVNPGVALTNKTLNIQGLERSVRNPTDTDALIIGGVLCVEDTPGGFKVVKSISTWTTDDNYNRVEVSTGVAADFVSREVRDAVDVLRGEKGSPILLSRAVSITESKLRSLAVPEPQGPGVIVGDAENPAYKNITASLVGDALSVQFQCSPGIPVNYIPVTIYAAPYSGSVSI